MINLVSILCIVGIYGILTLCDILQARINSEKQQQLVGKHAEVELAKKAS